MIKFIEDLINILRDYRAKIVLRKAFSKGLSSRMFIAQKLFNKYFERIEKNNINVVLVNIDCLRYRNTSYSGYYRKTTPFIDSFPNKYKAISAAPHTFPSVASLLTGYYPHSHGSFIKSEIKNFDKIRYFGLIRPALLTLPEIFQLLKYNTYFYTAIPASLFAFKGRIKPYILYKPACKLLRKVLKNIVEGGRPFFAYIHLGDLHEPLTIPPKEFENYFGDPKKIKNIRRWKYRRPEEQKGPEFEEYRFNRILFYDNVLRYVDYCIEEFYSMLDNRKIVDDTLFIITSDHGEEFWEHASIEAKYFFDPRGYVGVGHGHNVFNEIIEIPLVINNPIMKNFSKNLDQYVSSVDITPTILSVIGLSLKSNSKYLFDGMLLTERLRGKSFVLCEAIGYGYEKKAFININNNYKLLYSAKDDIQWVFDLNKDPYEEKPITDHEIIDEMVKQLKKFIIKNMLKINKLLRETNTLIKTM